MHVYGMCVGVCLRQNKCMMDVSDSESGYALNTLKEIVQVLVGRIRGQERLVTVELMVLAI